MFADTVNVNKEGRATILSRLKYVEFPKVPKDPVVLMKQIEGLGKVPADDLDIRCGWEGRLHKEAMERFSFRQIFHNDHLHVANDRSTEVYGRGEWENMACKQAVGSFIVLGGELDKNHSRDVTCGGTEGRPREIDCVTFVFLIDDGEGSTVDTIQLAEELELWELGLRWISGGIWVHNAGQILGRFSRRPYDLRN